MKTNSILVVLALIFLSACKEAKKETVTKDEKQEVVYTMTQLKEQQLNWKPRSQEAMKALFSIEILDDEALNIIDPNTEIEILANGFTWTEGPVWVEDGDYLLFSDIPNNKVYKLDSKRDTLTYLHPSGFSGDNFTGVEPGSNGLLVNAKGELILMQHGNRAVGKMKTSMHSLLENA